MQQKPICHFCKKNYSNEEMPLIAGDASFDGQRPLICAACIELFAKGMNQEEHAAHPLPVDAKDFVIPQPREIYDYLNRFVIGQDKTKKQLALAVVNHYKRIKQKSIPTPDQFKNVLIEKSNILMIGSTGSGKTLMARMLAQKMNVPFAIGDATSLTESGYVGEDVENLLRKLLVNAEGDVENTQRGIIYIDEIDKLRKTGGNVSITRDVGGEGVQQSLLKLIEGTTSSVPHNGGRKHPEQQYITVDTTDILFICGGSFGGLDDIVARRLGRGRIGFGEETSVRSDKTRNELFAQVRDDDLEQFGMIPELIGRLPIISALADLTLEDLIKILSEPENAILKQYQKLVAMDQKELFFTKEAQELIAKAAKEKGTGARALRSVVENCLDDLLFDLADAPKVVTVDADFINKKLKAA